MQQFKEQKSSLKIETLSLDGLGMVSEVEP